MQYKTPDLSIFLLIHVLCCIIIGFLLNSCSIGFVIQGVEIKFYNNDNNRKNRR